jgi:hypothetical protein
MLDALQFQPNANKYTTAIHLAQQLRRFHPAIRKHRALPRLARAGGAASYLRDLGRLAQAKEPWIDS